MATEFERKPFGVRMTRLRSHQVEHAPPKESGNKSPHSKINYLPFDTGLVAKQCISIIVVILRYTFTVIKKKPDSIITAKKNIQNVIVKYS